MITYIRGNLFESPAKVLVNTVNTVGVMGKGVAKIFKEIYPAMFHEYQLLCERGQLRVGSLWLYRTENKWVLNFPTKTDWRLPSKVEYVEEGLAKFAGAYASLGIASAAFPRLGCGNGELNWDGQIRPLMEKYLGPLPIDIFVYLHHAPVAIPEHREVERVKSWLRSEPRSLPFLEVWEDLKRTVSNGRDYLSWDSGASYRIEMTSGNESGFRIIFHSLPVWDRVRRVIGGAIPHEFRPRILAPGEVFVPREAMLELWEAARSFGFIVGRNLPEGLAALAEYILPVIAEVGYVRTVELSIGGQPLGRALQLYEPAMREQLRDMSTRHVLQSR